jgi:hypothetical protein
VARVMALRSEKAVSGHRSASYVVSPRIGISGSDGGYDG